MNSIPAWIQEKAFQYFRIRTIQFENYKLSIINIFFFTVPWQKEQY